MESRGRRRWRRGEGRWLFGAELQSLVSQAKTHDRYSCKTKVLWKEYLGDNIIISTRHSTLATTFQWDRVDPLGLRYSPAKEFGLIGSKARLLWIGVMIWHMIHIISYRYQHANVQADLLLGILVFPSKRFRVKTRLEGPLYWSMFSVMRRYRTREVSNTSELT